MAFKMKPFSGFGISPIKNEKNFEKFQAQKQKAIDFVEKLKPQIKKKKKIITKILTKAGTRAIPGVGAIGFGLDAFNIGKKMFKGKTASGHEHWRAVNPIYYMKEHFHECDPNHPDYHVNSQHPDLYGWCNCGGTSGNVTE